MRPPLASSISLSVRTIAVLFAMGITAYSRVSGQASDQGNPGAASGTWTWSVVGGRYVRANASNGVADWLRQNSFAATRPVCREVGGFFSGTHAVCDGAIEYPNVSNDGLVGGALGVRRRLSGRFSIEGIVASEPYGEVEGRCISSPGFQCAGDTAYVMKFNGFAAATLGAIAIKSVRLGAGPALSIEQWSGPSKIVRGLWLDASMELIPGFIARAQYRRYGFVRLDDRLPGGLRPSSFFLGVGVTS